LSIRNLLTFPWLKDKVETGALKLRGAFFAISEGVLYHLDEANDTFLPVE
jgi:carbonic anhydrase